MFIHAIRHRHTNPSYLFFRKLLLKSLSTSEVLGVPVLTGERRTINGLSSKFPKEKEIECISSQPL